MKLTKIQERLLEDIRENEKRLEEAIKDYWDAMKVPCNSQERDAANDLVDKGILLRISETHYIRKKI